MARQKNRIILCRTLRYFPVVHSMFKLLALMVCEPIQFEFFFKKPEWLTFGSIKSRSFGWAQTLKMSGGTKGRKEGEWVELRDEEQHQEKTKMRNAEEQSREEMTSEEVEHRRRRCSAPHASLIPGCGGGGGGKTPG